MAGHRGLDVMGHRCPGQPFAGGSVPLPNTNQSTATAYSHEGPGALERNCLSVPCCSQWGRNRNPSRKDPRHRRKICAKASVCFWMQNHVFRGGGTTPPIHPQIVCTCLQTGIPVEIWPNISAGSTGRPLRQTLTHRIGSPRLRVLYRLAPNAKRKGFRRRGPVGGPTVLRDTHRAGLQPRARPPFRRWFC
jgi:hypothetical protein